MPNVSTVQPSLSEDSGPTPSDGTGWPPAGGECGALIRQRDWSTTPLGVVDAWSPALRTTVSNIVNSPVPKVLMWGTDHVMLYNDAYRAVLGTQHPDALGRTTMEVWPEIAEWNREVLQRCLGGEIVCFREHAMTLMREDGPQQHVFDLFYTPVYEAAGAAAGVMCTVLDVTDRARQEAALRVGNRRFRTAMDAVHGVLWTNSADGRMTGEQPGWAALTGQTQQEYEGYGWADALHPDDAQGAIATWNAAVEGRTMFIHEHRVRRCDGAWRNFAVRGLPILREDGSIDEWVGVHTDITEQRAAERSLVAQATALAAQVRHRERAEEQLRLLNENLEARVIAEIDERRQAEAKLAQAQKLESIGKLTGGVAHDFNNLLMVASSGLDLLERTSDPARRERLRDGIRQAIDRGASLTQQLLAFSRRSPLKPEVIDIGQRLSGMHAILDRSLREDVTVRMMLPPDLWRVEVDASQLEVAVLNIAINARDAMPDGGTITIEARNEPSGRPDGSGDMVRLSIRDTGVGVAPDMIGRLFEPFFTTKAVGKGTGLGLSQVYGFARASGGEVGVDSVLGEGTTIWLRIPRSTKAPAALAPLAARAPVAGPGRRRVLLVEDDDSVAQLVEEMLRELGYEVKRVGDGASALDALRVDPGYQLVFSDMVMPGDIGGLDLARDISRLRPDLPVVLTTGYSAAAAAATKEGRRVLVKPYRIEALAAELDAVLSAGSTRTS